MSEADTDSSELLARLERLESDLKNGLTQLNSDLSELEEQENSIREYEQHLDSLSPEQVRELEEDLEVGTEEGKRNLEELQELLGMEEDSVKALAQITHRLDRRTGEVGETEDEIDSMLENLRQQAERGEVDEELAARCVAEIIETREKLVENAELEKEAAEDADNFGQELGEAHKDLVEMKRDETELKSEMKDAGSWAEHHHVSEMQSFVQEEGAPDLQNEIRELQREIRRQTGNEDQFLKTMAKLAEEGQLTEQQIDHLITQQQEWSTVMKQVLKDGSVGVKKIGEALLGFTPKGVAMGLAKGGVSEGLERIDTEQVLDTIGGIDEKVSSGAEEAEAEAESAINESENVKDRLEQAKAD
jgi:ribosomal protein L16/L10AE